MHAAKLAYRGMLIRYAIMCTSKRQEPNLIPAISIFISLLQFTTLSVNYSCEWISKTRTFDWACWWKTIMMPSSSSIGFQPICLACSIVPSCSREVRLFVSANLNDYRHSAWILNLSFCFVTLHKCRFQALSSL